MESNFIKERTVIRGEIIKKNLSDKKPSTSQDILLENPPERIVAFEEAINESLKQDLVIVSQEVSSVCEVIADYLKIKSALKILKQNPKDVRLQTNIGCNFYAQCHVDDATHIYLCVGKDYFLYMALDEALEMINFLEARWTRRLDDLQDKASKIKACIKIALEAAGRLYEIDRDKLTAD